MEDAFATQIEPLQSCDYPFSFFFDLIKPIWAGDLPPWPLHRLCTLMRKMRARSFVKESLHPNAELLEEQEMAAARCGTEQGKIGLLAHRFTFFASAPEPANWADGRALPDDHILGHAVVVALTLPNRDTRTYLHEAVVRTPALPFVTDRRALFWLRVPNYYMHNAADFCTVLGTPEKNRRFSIKGTFFTHQNDLTSVCAHAALRMAFNSSPTLLGQQCPRGKLTNGKINEILGMDHVSKGKKVGRYLEEESDGLTLEQMTTVIERCGARAHSAAFFKNTTVEYDQFIYPFLESRFPVIMGIEGWDAQNARLISHVVAVLGHTLNTDRWEPEARVGYHPFPVQVYIPATKYVDHYVISDDNYGMHLALPSDMARNLLVPSRNPDLHASIGVGISPSEVKVTGYTAEQEAVYIAWTLLNHLELEPQVNWFECLKSRALDRIIFRTLYVTKKRYLSHMRETADYLTADMPAGQASRLAGLPNHLWLTELSVPHIYDGNKHKLGDIVVAADAEDQALEDYSNFAMAWFPGIVKFGIAAPAQPWFVREHVPFFRYEGVASDLEW